MSRKICVQFEIRNMLILKDTLTQMGINYDEVGSSSIRTSMGITFKEGADHVNCDSAYEDQVNSIKQNYMVNFYKDKAIREGAKLRQETLANGTVRLYLSHT